MTDSTDAQLAVAIAEIERLRHQNMLLQADVYTLRKEQHLDHLLDRLRIMEENQVAAAREADRHISRLQCRIIELEAAAALTHGTLAVTPETSGPVIITGNHPPSAPPHVGHTIKWPPSIGNDDE